MRLIWHFRLQIWRLSKKESSC